MPVLPEKSYSRRVVKRASERTRDNINVELIASILVGAAGSLVAGFTVGGLVLAIASGLVLFTATIGASFLLHLALAPRSLDKNAQREIAELKLLTAPRLIFEIDERTTRINLYEPFGEHEILSIAARIYLRFENRDKYPTSMKKLNVTLHELCADQSIRDVFTMVSFAYKLNGTLIKESDFEGMMIQEGRLTPLYLVEVYLTINDESVKSAADLQNGVYFLRLSMEAGGTQSPFSADFHLSWKHALGEEGTAVTLVTNAPTIKTDRRRI